jgi:hypothetical protein
MSINGSITFIVGILFYHKEHKDISQSSQSFIFKLFNSIILCVLCAFFENSVVNIQLFNNK